MKSGLHIRLYALLLCCLSFAIAERIRDKIYVPIAGASCFRRLNGTHQTGCSSTYAGSVGVLHLIKIEEDFDFIVNNPPAPPYAPMIPTHLFTRKNILRLKNEAKRNVSVVLLIKHIDLMTQFSHELNCPNQYSGIVPPNGSEATTCDAQNPRESWNPWGTGLLHEDFPFPIYYIEDRDEIKVLIDCFEKFNNFDYEMHAQSTLCSIQVDTFMSAAVSSEVCMRRTNYINNLGHAKFCDPLEGHNVYGTLFPRPPAEAITTNVERKVNVNEKFILVTARLDTTSMFDGVGLGAMDSLTGFATLIGIAQMLKQTIQSQTSLPDRNMNVLFIVFNGESYDYIGSQRFVYDLENLEFPTQSTQTAAISFENILFMVDIGVVDTLSDIKVHTVIKSTQSSSFIEKLQKYGSSLRYGFNINFESVVGYQMPPTSAQSFLRKNSTYPAIVVNSKPTNKYYHSIYDNEDNIDFHYANTSMDFSSLMKAEVAFKYFRADAVQMKIRNISSVIGMALIETLANTEYTGDELVNPQLIDEFLYCFLQSADCPLFKAASYPDSLNNVADIPPTRYISVAGGPQESAGWTYRIFGYLLGSIVANATKESCNHLPYSWMAGFEGRGECHLMTQNYSHALSPAFLIEDYNWASGKYSTWTESTWSQFSARMFLKPSKTHEAMVLSIGVVVLIFSFFIVYVVSKKSDVLFEATASSRDALTAPTRC